MILSIIIPLYNCENEIKRCLSSIIDNIENSNNYQREIEVIVVNDGSTDNSLNIAQQIANNYTFIKIISQNNLGVSEARNTGIKIATGKYIWFIDSDDYIPYDTIRYLIQIIIKNNLEILSFSSVCGTLTHLENYKIKQNFNDLSNIISGIEYIANYQYTPYLWKYIFRKQLIIDNNIYFAAGKTIGEDTLFTTSLFLLATRFASVDAECYYYVTRENSITHNQNITHQDKLIDDYIYVAKHLSELLTTISKEKHYTRIEDRRNSFIFFALIKVLRYLPNRVNEVINILKQENLYPFRQLSPNNYPGIKYRILCWCMNRQYIWKSLCKLKSLLTK